MIPFLFHSTVFGSSLSLASPFRREPKRHPKRVSSEFQRLRTWNLRSSKYFASWIVKRYFFIFNTARISPKKKGLKESQCSSKAQRTFSKRFCLIIVTLPVFQKLTLKTRKRWGGEKVSRNVPLRQCLSLVLPQNLGRQLMDRPSRTWEQGVVICGSHPEIGTKM